MTSSMHPDAQRTDRPEAMAQGGSQVIAVLIADDGQGGEQPVHRVQ